jgi:hypothetical protein
MQAELASQNPGQQMHETVVRWTEASLRRAGLRILLVKELTKPYLA